MTCPSAETTGKGPLGMRADRDYVQLLVPFPIPFAAISV
jgi:hypothetical protein